MCLLLCIFFYTFYNWKNNIVLWWRFREPILFDGSLFNVQISVSVANHKLKPILDCLKCALTDGLVAAIKLLT